LNSLPKLTYNLRFPGQYYQAETGLNQNVNRDYDPLTGKYIESDPSGIHASEQIFSKIPILAPLALYPTTAVNGRLVSIWISASGAYRVLILAYEHGAVVPVLDAGSKVPPEFAYGSAIAPDAAEHVILSQGEWSSDRRSATFLRPTTADVYVWDGKSYEEHKGVPWAERLRE
jgi:RHS repeat-associated protein